MKQLVNFIETVVREFANDVSCEMNKKLGIETGITPEESTLSNGVAERNNKVLYEALMKTMEDAKCDMEAALTWAVKKCINTKYAFQNYGRYSQNQ